MLLVNALVFIAERASIRTQERKKDTTGTREAGHTTDHGKLVGEKRERVGVGIGGNRVMSSLSC